VRRRWTSAITRRECSSSKGMRCSWVSLSFRSRYGIPYSVVPATQTFQDVDFTRYASESDPGPNGWIGTNPMMSGASNGETMYPFFTGMHLEGNPMPGGTPGSLPGDQHGIVLLQGASGCKVYDSNDGWLNNGQDGKDKLIYELAGDFGNLSGSDFEAIQSGKAENTGL